MLYAELVRYDMPLLDEIIHKEYGFAVPLLGIIIGRIVVDIVSEPLCCTISTNTNENDDNEIVIEDSELFSELFTL